MKLHYMKPHLVYNRKIIVLDLTPVNPDSDLPRQMSFDRNPFDRIGLTCCDACSKSHARNLKYISQSTLRMTALQWVWLQTELTRRTVHH